jgi:hypothetical protein
MPPIDFLAIFYQEKAPREWRKCFKSRGTFVGHSFRKHNDFMERKEVQLVAKQLNLAGSIQFMSNLQPALCSP